ncbi:MAG: alpha/beta fold hydrolase [Anaerolineae bacterium]
MRTRTKLTLFAAVALGGMAYANQRVALGYRPIYSEVEGEPDIYPWDEGVAYFHVKGEGQPIVLLHDFTVGASSQQMQPLFDRLAEHYRVYALDWLGYGQSTRPPLEYTAETYERMLSGFLADVVRGPAVVVAAGPAAAVAVHLAWLQTEKISRLVLVCPTGVDRMIEAPRLYQDVMRWLLKTPTVGTFIYNLIASERVIRWRLRNRVFFEPSAVTDEMVRYLWVSAHQPGAKWGPLSHWTGTLNLCTAYEFTAMAQPTMVVWGQQARETPVEEIQGFKRLRPSARYRAFDRTGQWPQYEAAGPFAALIHNWIEGRDVGAAAIFPGDGAAQPRE